MYFRVPVRGHTKRIGVNERIGGLGQTDPAQYVDPGLTDTSVTPTAPDFSFTVDTSSLPAPPIISAPVDTGAPSGSAFTDFLNAITGAARTATAVYSAADLIQINQQRAARGMLPIDAYGNVGSTGTVRQATGAFGLSTPMLLILGGVVLVAVLRR